MSLNLSKLQASRNLHSKRQGDCLGSGFWLLHNPWKPDTILALNAIPLWYSHVPNKILNILARLDPRIHPVRAINFFNQFDLVIGDLRNGLWVAVTRYLVHWPSLTTGVSPDDTVISWTTTALRRLDLFYQIIFSQGSADVNQWAIFTSARKFNNGATSGICCHRAISFDITGFFPSPWRPRRLLHGAIDEPGKSIPDKQMFQKGLRFMATAIWHIGLNPQLSRRANTMRLGRTVSCAPGDVCRFFQSITPGIGARAHLPTDLNWRCPCRGWALEVVRLYTTTDHAFPFQKAGGWRIVGSLTLLLDVETLKKKLRLGLPIETMCQFSLVWYRSSEDKRHQQFEARRRFRR